MNMQRKSSFRFDPLIVLPIAYLTVISIVVLRSITLTSQIAIDFSFATQVIAVLIGVAVFIAAQQTRELWQRLSLPLYLLSTIALVLVLFYGDASGGATRWIQIGSFQFQPSELAKFALILVQAQLLSRRADTLARPWPLLLSAVYVAVPVLLVIRQPDIGTAVIIIAVWLAQLFASPLSRRTFVLILGLFFLAVPAVYPFLADYQQERIESFLNPSIDTQAEGYNVLQSTIAVGSGGWLGKGIDAGTQSQLNFLPAQHTDFIFAVIAEKLGFVGAVSVIIALAVLMLRLALLSLTHESIYVQLVGIGVIGILLLQTLINIGMNIGLLPVTGIPLPFVSGGGTHLVLEFAMVGTLIGVIRGKQG